MERIYVVPLRKEWLKVPRWKRAKKAVKALKEFAAKHMKAETVMLGKYVNKELWKHGIKNPPYKVKVNCSKDDKGVVAVELVGAPVEKKEEKKAKKVAKTETKKSEEEIKKELNKLKEKTEEAKEKKEEAKPEAPKEEKPAEKEEKKQ
ncbi:60S ribosomal protein L31 [Candidatus Woesearchaeota archaeon]|nr:60S ribosomal protein L31 [Candidatus Woesearchaeota archaeon]